MVHVTSPTTLFVYIIVVLVTAFASSLMSYMGLCNNEWYGCIEKPEIANHGVVFSVVWWTLYLLMAVGGYYGDIAVVEKRPRSWVIAIRVLFGLQLLFGFLWVVFFFGMGSFLLALLASILHVIAIIGLMVLYIQVSELAFWVFVPVVVWAFFALVMTFYIWRCNRSSGVLGVMMGDYCGTCGGHCGCKCGQGGLCGCGMMNMKNRMGSGMGMRANPMRHCRPMC